MSFNTLVFASHGSFGLNFDPFQTNIINLAIVIAILVKFLPGFLGGILQRRHIRRGRRRWRAQNVFEHKQSTLHRGCARRIRRNGQHRPVGEDTTTRAARWQFHEP